MPSLPWPQDNIIVLDVEEDEPLINVKCALCNEWGHRLESDGSLVCAHCEIAIAAHETVARPSILKVNLPRTWQVSSVA